SRRRADERAADPLHRAWVNAEPFGNAAYTLTSTLTLVQRRLDALLQLGRSATQSFSLILGPPKPGADSFRDHRPLKLGKHAHHLKLGFATRCRGVQTLLMQKQVDVASSTW